MPEIKHLLAAGRRPVIFDSEKMITFLDPEHVRATYCAMFDEGFKNIRLIESALLTARDLLGVCKLADRVFDHVTLETADPRVATKAWYPELDDWIDEYVFLCYGNTNISYCRHVRRKRPVRFNYQASRTSQGMVEKICTRGYSGVSLWLDRDEKLEQQFAVPRGHTLEIVPRADLDAGVWLMPNLDVVHVDKADLT